MHKFPENPNFRDSLLSDEKEIQGLILVSLIAISRILVSKKFTIPNQAAKEEWRRASSIVRDYVESRLEEGRIRISGEIDSRMLLEDFKEFVKENYKEKNTPTLEFLSRKLREAYHVRSERVRKDGIRIKLYKGISFSPDYVKAREIFV